MIRCPAEYYCMEGVISLADYKLKIAAKIYSGIESNSDINDKRNDLTQIRELVAQASALLSKIGPKERKVATLLEDCIALLDSPIS